jgi:hypothetical protein
LVVGIGDLSGAIKLLLNNAFKIAHQLLPCPDSDLSVVRIYYNSMTPVFRPGLFIFYSQQFAGKTLAVFNF